MPKGFDEVKSYSKHRNETPRVPSMIERMVREKQREIEKREKLLTDIQKTIPKIEQDLKDLEQCFRDLKTLGDKIEFGKSAFLENSAMLESIVENLSNESFETVKNAYEKDMECGTVMASYRHSEHIFSDKRDKIWENIQRIDHNIESIEELTSYQPEVVTMLSIKELRDEYTRDISSKTEEFRTYLASRRAARRALETTSVSKQDLDAIEEWLRIKEWANKITYDADMVQ
jgi:cell division septum initiation protein DivIVA